MMDSAGDDGDGGKKGERTAPHLHGRGDNDTGAANERHNSMDGGNQGPPEGGTDCWCGVDMDTISVRSYLADLKRRYKCLVEGTVANGATHSRLRYQEISIKPAKRENKRRWNGIGSVPPGKRAGAGHDHGPQLVQGGERLGFHRANASFECIGFGIIGPQKILRNKVAAITVGFVVDFPNCREKFRSSQFYSVRLTQSQIYYGWVAQRGSSDRSTSPSLSAASSASSHKSSHPSLKKPRRVKQAFTLFAISPDNTQRGSEDVGSPAMAGKVSLPNEEEQAALTSTMLHEQQDQVKHSNGSAKATADAGAEETFGTCLVLVLDWSQKSILVHTWHPATTLDAGVGVPAMMKASAGDYTLVGSVGMPEEMVVHGCRLLLQLPQITATPKAESPISSMKYFVFEPSEEEWARRLRAAVQYSRALCGCSGTGRRRASSMLPSSSSADPFPAEKRPKQSTTPLEAANQELQDLRKAWIEEEAVLASECRAMLQRCQGSMAELSGDMNHFIQHEVEQIAFQSNLVNRNHEQALSEWRKAFAVHEAKLRLFLDRTLTKCRAPADEKLRSKLDESSWTARHMLKCFGVVKHLPELKESVFTSDSAVGLMAAPLAYRRRAGHDCGVHVKQESKEHLDTQRKPRKGEAMDRQRDPNDASVAAEEKEELEEKMPVSQSDASLPSFALLDDEHKGIAGNQVDGTVMITSNPATVTTFLNMKMEGSSLDVICEGEDIFSEEKP